MKTVMETPEDKIATELKRMADMLHLLAQNQQIIKNEIRMIFADISQFENLVVKVLDTYQSLESPKEKIH
jgi:hypothetical protein